MATGIIVKYFEDYSHFGPNDIPKNAGKKIAAEWEHLATLMDKMNSEKIISALHVEGIRNWIDSDIDNYKADIAGMLLSLAEAFNAFYEEGDWIYIEGV